MANDCQLKFSRFRFCLSALLQYTEPVVIVDLFIDKCFRKKGVDKLKMIYSFPFKLFMGSEQ